MTESASHLRFGLTLLYLAAVSHVAQAQTTPSVPPTTDPAQLQRQREALERERLAPVPKPLAPRLTAPQQQPESPPPAGPSFLLRKVEFTPPSQLLNAEDLEAVAAPQIGRPTSFADVRALAQGVNALYMAKGHLTARAFVPSQKIVDGVLKVQLVEARLAALQMAAESRLSPAFVESLLATSVGTLIDAPVLNERLTKLHRNTETRIGLAFEPAATGEPGLSVIQVQADEPPFWTARLSASNEGADSLERNQLSANLALNNLLGRTDKLSLLLIGSKGSTSGNLQYSLPLPGPFLGWGTRLTTGLSIGKTQSVSPGFDPVQLDGKSDGATVSMTQPLWASGSWALDGGLSISQTNSRTDIASERFSNVRTRSTGLTATLSRNSDGSSATLVLAYNDARTTAMGLADRRTGVLQVNASLQQLLGAGFWGALRAAAQHSNTVQLPSALQFQIGGPGSVRGYASPSVSGDNGETGSIELHRALTPVSERLDAFVFVDAGRVRTDGGVSASLTSAGVGLTYTADRWSAAATVASPTKSLRGEKPGTRTLLRVSVDLDRVIR
jgi:hemolysin activation/secretion protein